MRLKFLLLYVVDAYVERHTLDDDISSRSGRIANFDLFFVTQ